MPELMAPLRPSKAEIAGSVGGSKRITRFRLVVLLLIFLSYMIAGADRANIGVVIPFMKREMPLTNTDIGLMAGLFYLTYAAVQIPSGLLMERYGTRRIFSFSLVATSVATLTIGLVSSVLQLKLARALLGFAEGPLNVGSVATIGRWFPAGERGRAIGVFMAAVKFSPAVVPPLCAAIILHFGWRAVFYWFAAPGLVLALLWLLLVADRPEESKFTNSAEAEYITTDAGTSGPGKDSGGVQRASPFIDRLIRAHHVAPIGTRIAAIRSFDLWACAVGYGFLVGIAYTIMTWLPTYLIEVKHLAVMQMGVIAAIPWVGGIVGNLLGGFLSDRVFAERRKPVMLITAASTILSMYSLIYATPSPVVLGILFLLVGILLNLGYSTFLVYPMRLVDKRLVPFAASIVNTLGAIGGALAPTAVGAILDRSNWNTVFLFLALCSFATLLVVVAMREPLPPLDGLQDD